MRFYLTAGMILVLLVCIFWFSGCGQIRWVPNGQTPPAGSTPIGTAALNVLGAVESSGWGDVIQVLAGVVGCGGVVAVGRKIVRNRQTRKALETTNAVQDVALQDIIAGVQELIRCDKAPGSIKNILNGYQSATTKKLVATTKIDLDLTKLPSDATNPNSN